MSNGDNKSNDPAVALTKNVCLIDAFDVRGLPRGVCLLLESGLSVPGLD